MEIKKDGDNKGNLEELKMPRRARFIVIAVVDTRDIWQSYSNFIRWSKLLIIASAIIMETTPMPRGSVSLCINRNNAPRGRRGGCVDRFYA